MKRSFIFLCAAMVLLSGCGSRTVSSEAPSLTVSASAVSVYGRSYVPAQPLPAKVSTPQEARAAESTLWRCAETPDSQAALYSLDHSEQILIQWNGKLAMFENWSVSASQDSVPWMVCADLDHSGDDESLIICAPTVSENGNTLETLHLIQMEEHDVFLDQMLPEALYQEQLSELLRVKVRGNSAQLSLDNLSLAIPAGQSRYTGEASLNERIQYSIDQSDRLQLKLGIGLSVKKVSTPVIGGEILCDISFDADISTYTLSNFALGNT